ncbi:Sulfotransferase domain [Dillenia turbinata]|uniref:Sulfotransferase n=1 Tax=Dillenia turbinata TaxID=194707 RepID=A0AAN8V0D0_9MAGN
MEPSLLSQQSNIIEENVREKINQQFEELVATLPSDKGFLVPTLINYKGFWCTPGSVFKGVLLMQDQFKARSTDIFLCSALKSGTTWLKALMFATMNRSKFQLATHPLLTTGPHNCMPYLDVHIIDHDVEALPSPRLLSSHCAYFLLPKSTRESSDCKIVYICRNPKDMFVSHYLFAMKLRPPMLPPISMEEAFDLFCRGVCEYGPHLDHVLGYWKASLESPGKILFLKYEEMRKDPVKHVKHLAEFLGKPFSAEEEKAGVIEEIVKLCSFEKLTSLEVNKTGKLALVPGMTIGNENFFRKGEVGDSKNHLTPEMIERLDKITEEKLKGTGFAFGE